MRNLHFWYRKLIETRKIVNRGKESEQMKLKESEQMKRGEERKGKRTVKTQPYNKRSVGGDMELIVCIFRSCLHMEACLHF